MCFFAMGTYLEHLSNVLVSVYIDIKILDFAVVSLNCIDELWLKDVAGTTPRSTSLDHNWSLAVLQSVLPITI